jgi:hypothetical protein
VNIKCLEAAELRRQGRYSASEAAVELAVEMVKQNPWLQDGPKNEPAQTYLAEGLNEAAVELWRPIYQHSGLAVEPCGLAIAFARSNRAEEGAKIVSKYFEDCRRGIAELSEDNLPIATGITRESVEATALLLWSATQPNPFHPKETIDQLDRASKLSPHNAGIHFYLAQWKEVLLKAKWAEVEADYAEVYRFDGKRMHEIATYRLTTHKVKLPELSIK